MTDLKQRGLLDDTLVIWGGEFGRTVYAQGGANRDNYGRDHHGSASRIWMAGGGIKAGHTHGASDDFGFNVVADGVHVHDLQATILHCSASTTNDSLTSSRAASSVSPMSTARW